MEDFRFVGGGIDELGINPGFETLACLQRTRRPKLNCYSSVRLGRASFADRSRNCIEHLHKADLKNNVLIVIFILCLQRVIKMARNLLQSVLWPLVLRVCDK